MPQLETTDMQGPIVRGYADLVAARYLMLKFNAPTSARQWLSVVLPQITPGFPKPHDVAANIAFTWPGFTAMGLPTAPPNSNFSDEFLEGMVEAHRSRTLGDVDESAPTEWAWGGPSQPPIHAVLLLFTPTWPQLDTLTKTHTDLLAVHGIDIVNQLETSDLKGYEHFGFRDGISQPFIPGFSDSPSTAPAANTVQPGEFILGYNNEYSLQTERPLLAATVDPKTILPRAIDGSADFGRNGSYLIFRTLRQDVLSFHKFTTDAAKSTAGITDAGKIAAKMVGRWPEGAPLVLSPDKDDPTKSKANDFTYFAPDVQGLKCPIGAHVRRSNPRDSLDPKPGTDASVSIGKRHRLLRRGREYGPPVTPAELSAAQNALLPLSEQPDRGLHFLCFAGNISRQFEFIQISWQNNAKFAGLYDDADPLLGARAPAAPGGCPVGGTLTIPADPLRVRIPNMPRFVTVRGGAYFFMPGMRALKFLASLAS